MIPIRRFRRLLHHIATFAKERLDLAPGYYWKLVTHAMLLIVTACASGPLKAYDGPDLLSSEVSVIRVERHTPRNFQGRKVLLTAVSLDGKTSFEGGTARQGSFLVTPGRHSLVLDLVADQEGAEGTVSIAQGSSEDIVSAPLFSFPPASCSETATVEATFETFSGKTYLVTSDDTKAELSVRVTEGDSGNTGAAGPASIAEIRSGSSESRSKDVELEMKRHASAVDPSCSRGRRVIDAMGVGSQ